LYEGIHGERGGLGAGGEKKRMWEEKALFESGGMKKVCRLCCRLVVGGPRKVRKKGGLVEEKEIRVRRLNCKSVGRGSYC